MSDKPILIARRDLVFICSFLCQVWFTWAFMLSFPDEKEEEGPWKAPLDFDAVHWDPEPTPNPSQEGNWHDADECLLPSREGSGVGWFMESPLSHSRMHWDHEPFLTPGQGTRPTSCRPGALTGRFMESPLSFFPHALGP